MADLVARETIPKLAAEVNSSPEMLQVLRRIQQAGFIKHGSGLEPDMARILRRLTELGLVDPAFEAPGKGRPHLWVNNGNGLRVLSYLASIEAGPYYEIPSRELASWLAEQGEDRWWNVDGDPLLTGRRTFPCPARELAAELRTIDRMLLFQAKKEDVDAKGQTIGKDKLNELVGRFADKFRSNKGEQPPLWSEDRLLYLCWKGSRHDWLLVEDSQTRELMRQLEFEELDRTDAPQGK